MNDIQTRRGAFVDEKGVRWDPNNANFEGYLSKKSKWMGEWRNRYFILKGTKLFFAKNSKSAPHGLIDLADCVSVHSAEKKANKNNAIEIVLTSDSYLLQASNEKDKDDWLAQIGIALVKNSGLYLEPEDVHDIFSEEELELQS